MADAVLTDEVEQQIPISYMLKCALEQLAWAETNMKKRDWHESWLHDIAGIHDKLAQMRDNAENAEALTADELADRPAPSDDGIPF